MKPPVIFIKNKNKLLEVEICKIADWDGFDKLVLFLKQYYSAKVIDTFDGLSARKYILETDGVKYQLIYDDFFGNSICSLSPESDILIKKIGGDLEQRLKIIE
jgi:hypothetical protein